MFLKALITGVVAIICYSAIPGFLKTPAIPPALEEDAWWGARSRDVAVDHSIRPFFINVSDHDLQYLQGRLKSFKFPVAPLKGVNFEYGFNIDFLKNVTSHWLKSYDWRSREKLLNRLSQFKTQISGLDIHFIHVKQNAVAHKRHKVVPILLLHGWPGSVKEFYSLISLLTSPRKDSDYVFEVVAPSLPGYGFSEAAAYPGLGPATTGIIFKKLMHKLGYEKFYIHGGDWGAMIGQGMSILYPKYVLGFHCTICRVKLDLYDLFLIILGNYWPSLISDSKLKYKLFSFSDTLAFMWTELGYMHLQATKPDTIGTALLDTPVGLAAYILEKFSTWTNLNFRTLPDGGLTKKYDLDDLLDNVMLYWWSDSILTAMRLYSETFSLSYRTLGLDTLPVKVPTVCAQFPHELANYPPVMLREKYTNLVKVSEFEDGGHFAAFELPNVVADDIFISIPLFVNASISEATKNE